MDRNQCESPFPAPEAPPQFDCAEARDMVEKLWAEKEALRERLEIVVNTAAGNESIWRRFAEIERILFRTIQLDQLAEQLLSEIKERFQLDAVVLFINHPEIIDRFFPEISEESEPIAQNTWILPVSGEVMQTIFGNSPGPILLSPDNIAEFQKFFPIPISSIGSGVLVPLCFHEILFGCMFLGSSSTERYQLDDGTELLAQLGMKIALCLDNCLIYERVKDLAVQDQWTGLLSFFQIHTILEREMRKAHRLREPLSIILIALDYYNEGNEYSEIGTEILKHVAALMKQIFTDDDGFIGRYGSNEFVAVLPALRADEACRAGDFLTQLIRKSPLAYKNTAILIHPTMAVVEMGDEMRRTQDMLDAANIELCRLRMKRPQ